MLKEISERTSKRRIAQNLPERRYRPELHGVRGLAILGVVLFHLFGQGRVSGGIDIFLTISGFLFTAMLMREVTEKGGVINFARYFGRLFRRIFVPAAIVIVVTVAVGLLIFPPAQHAQVWTEALASLLYFENIELIRSHLAYEAASQDVSTFQHFWSLSVQGQFYLVMPFIAVGAYLLARRLKTSATTVMGWTLVAVLVASLAFAVYVGSYAQDEAYLMTRTRVWQFAFGGLLALLIDRIRLSSTVRFVLGYVGLLSIALVGFLVDGAQHFPGPLALWPLFGFAFVLLAAPDTADQEAEPWSAPHLLSNRVFAWIGDHAYGLYLWHWPLLIFYLALRDRATIGIRGAAVIFVGSLVLAMVMHELVEKPLDRIGKQRRGAKLDWASLSAGVTAMVVGVLIAFPQIPQQGDLTASALEINTETHPGALSISHDLPVGEAEPIPEVTELHRKLPEYRLRGCEQTGGDAPGTDEVTVCDDPDAPANPTARVVLAAGSHAGQWEDAVRTIGRSYDWEVLVVVKSGCVLRDEAEPESPMCQAWNENFIDWLGEHEVDLVITPGTRIFSHGETIPEGAQTRWEEITQHDVDLLLIRGTPRPRGGGAKCVQSERPVEECGTSAGHVGEPSTLLSMDLPARTETIDLNPAICPNIEEGPDAWCPALTGNVYVWRDDSHLSREYVTTLAPAFEHAMRTVFPKYFD
ncbi:acyltransferase family protein [Enteractinococcus coprophilus]|nr:acyltransferase family protein [Enteractinococcus coprophilus]